MKNDFHNYSTKLYETRFRYFDLYLYFIQEADDGEMDSYISI